MPVLAGLQFFGVRVDFSHLTTCRCYVRLYADVTDPQSVDPVEPEVAARQETAGGVSGHVVDPALLDQLSHGGVDEGVAGLTVFPLL